VVKNERLAANNTRATIVMRVRPMMYRGANAMPSKTAGATSLRLTFVAAGGLSASAGWQGWMKPGVLERDGIGRETRQRFHGAAFGFRASWDVWRQRSAA